MHNLASQLKHNEAVRDDESDVVEDNIYNSYVHTFTDILTHAVATDARGQDLAMKQAIVAMGQSMRNCHDQGGRIMLIGNGGSAGICSHMATDISKNGGMRATAFNDGATLTCLANDYGYEYVFAKQIEWHAKQNDILFAISSSGNSQNILNGVNEARKKGCLIYTLSGFKGENKLRPLGDINIYLNSMEYGFVEVGHLTIIHAILDVQLGWKHSEL